MAFRVQDPVSGLFWEVDSGNRVRLGENGSVYTHTDDGSIMNSDTGMPLRIAGNKIVEGDWSVKWTINDGIISIDDEHIINYDECSSSMCVTGNPATWIMVPVGSTPIVIKEPVVASVAEPVAEPVVESETEDDEVPELVDGEEEEDVPVARGSALIEEALNAQAVVSDDEA